jgi:hypothetical protein
MSQPIIVTLSHRLGKAEVTATLESEFQRCSVRRRGPVRVQEPVVGRPPGFSREPPWTEHDRDRGCRRDHVRLEVQLPWLLSMLANKAKALVEKQGKLMLEKPVKQSTPRS